MTQILLTYLNFGYLTSASHVGGWGLWFLRAWITKISFESHLHLLRWENNLIVYNQATKTVKNPGYPFFNLQPFIGRIFMFILQKKTTTKSLIIDNINSIGIA